MTAASALTPRNSRSRKTGGMGRSIRVAVTPSNDGNAASTSGGWQHQAACLDEDPELFFPIGTGDPARHQAEQAKEVCSRCPVRVQCLQAALVSRPEQGVWGGLTEQERNDLLRRRRGPAYADTVPPSWPARPRWSELLTYRGVVEERLAAGVSQRRIAESLGFDRGLITELAALIQREQMGKAA